MARASLYHSTRKKEKEKKISYFNCDPVFFFLRASEYSGESFVTKDSFRCVGFRVLIVWMFQTIVSVNSLSLNLFQRRRYEK